jgi:hypothetical protein
MTADLMDDWVKDVYERCPGTLHNPPSLDAFCEYLSEELKIKLEKRTMTWL